MYLPIPFVWTKRPLLWLPHDNKAMENISTQKEQRWQKSKPHSPDNCNGLLRIPACKHLFYLPLTPQGKNVFFLFPNIFIVRRLKVLFHKLFQCLDFVRKHNCWGTGNCFVVSIPFTSTDYFNWGGPTQWILLIRFDERGNPKKNFTKWPVLVHQTCRVRFINSIDGLKSLIFISIPVRCPLAHFKQTHREIWRPTA